MLSACYLPSSLYYLVSVLSATSLIIWSVLKATQLEWWPSFGRQKINFLWVVTVIIYALQIMKLDWKKSCDLLTHIVETKLGHSSVHLVGKTLIYVLPGPSSSLKGLLAEKCNKLEAKRASEGLPISPSKKYWWWSARSAGKEGMSIGIRKNKRVIGECRCFSFIVYFWYLFKSL